MGAGRGVVKVIVNGVCMMLDRYQSVLRTILGIAATYSCEERQILINVNFQSKANMMIL